MTSKKKLTKVSIITTSYTCDRFNDITELLDSIKGQGYKYIETLIVTERSPELANSVRNYIAKQGYSNMRVLYNDGEWGSYPSRNLAIKQVDGDIIAFVDDDALLFPDWAEKTVKSYAKDRSVIGVTGPILPLWEKESMSWFPRELYWIFSCTSNAILEKVEVRNGYATNLSFHREAFDRCGLFKSSLVGKGRGRSDWQQPAAQETEFCIRVKRITGKRIIYDPDTKVHHKVYSYRLSTRFITKRAYWEGYAKAMLNHQYHPAYGKAVLSTEYKLLRRILFKLLPQTLVHLFRQPATSLRQLWAVLIVLSCVAGGYLSYNLSTLFCRREPYGTG